LPAQEEGAIKAVRTALAALFFLSFSPLSAQWARTYGTPSDERLINVTSAPGGGYFVALGFFSGFAYAPGAVILKIAEDGRIVWQKTIPGSFSSRDLSSTSDGGAVFWVGQYGLDGVVMIKFSREGIPEWTRRHSTYDIRGGASDGGYILAEGSGYYNGFCPKLVKITAAGDVEWSRIYMLNLVPRAVVQTGDGGYLLTGYQGIFPSGPPQEAILLKLDGSGRVQWQKSFGQGYISSLIRLPTGELLARGYVGIAGPLGSAFIQLNDNGDVLRCKAGGVGGFSSSCVPTPDGGFFLALPQSDRFIAAKFDRQLNSEWTKSYPYGSQILPGNDQSYLLAWSGVRPGALGTDIMVAKVDSDGGSVLSCLIDENVEISLVDIPLAPFTESPATVFDAPAFSTPFDVVIQEGGANTGFLCDENAAILSVWPKRLAFGAVQSGSSGASQNFLIENSGGGSLSWSIQTSESWIVCQPTSGTGAQMTSVSVDVSGLSPGQYQGQIQISADGAENSPLQVHVELDVHVQGATAGPFGYFDTPGDGWTVHSSIPVTGWALDDIEVKKVDIWRDPVGGEPVHPNGYVYIGDAMFVEGARPDVETAYPTYPLNYRAGWGYMMLTNFLPNGGNGTFTLHALATDQEGNTVELGSKTITCDNAQAIYLFGAIDTPAQGETWNGTQVNFGWALTPQPKSIPTDGSTILLWIDGLPVGHPTYNNYRVDIATLFPGYANSNGVVGYYYVDTTQYVNGVHTIAWSVEDSAGIASGIGSRYFTVVNTATGSAAGSGDTAAFRLPSQNNRYNAASIADQANIPTDYLSPVRVKRGYNPEALAEAISPDADGVINIEAQEVDRIKVALSENGASESLPDRVRGREKPARTSDHEYVGYLIVGNQLRPLPIGSFLDSMRGVFSWQLGPGFIGEYNFVFMSQDRSGIKNKKNIRVRILPALQMKR
jgi:hypothetical protein